MSIPIYDADAPVTCTATSEEIPVRIEQIERMRSNLDRIERSEHGLLLHFPNRPGIEGDLRKFTVDEKGCCQFWGFHIVTRPDELILRWDAPPSLDDYITRLLTFFKATNRSPPPQDSSERPPLDRSTAEGGRRHATTGRRPICPSGIL